MSTSTTSTSALGTNSLPIDLNSMVPSLTKAVISALEGNLDDYSVKEVARSPFAEKLIANIRGRQGAAATAYQFDKLATKNQRLLDALDELMGTSEFKKIPKEQQVFIENDRSQIASTKEGLEYVKKQAEEVMTYGGVGNRNLGQMAQDLADTAGKASDEFRDTTVTLTNNLKKFGLFELFQKCCNPTLQHQQILQQQQQSSLDSSAPAATGASSKAPANAPLTTVVAERQQAARDAQRLQGAEKKVDLIRAAQKDAQEEEALRKKLEEKRQSELKQNTGQSGAAAAA